MKDGLPRELAPLSWRTTAMRKSQNPPQNFGTNTKNTLHVETSVELLEKREVSSGFVCRRPP